MILARAVPESTPRVVWDDDTCEESNDGKIDIDESGSHKEPTYNCPQEKSRCFEVRSVQFGEHSRHMRKDRNNIDRELYEDIEEKDSFDPGKTIDNVNSLGEHGAVEELWIVGKRQVEWRREGKPVKRFTGDEIALQVLWTKFASGVKDPDCIMRCIAIREKERLRIYSEGGREFLIHLPFALCSIWNTKYGLLLERSDEHESKDSVPNNYSSHAQVVPEAKETSGIKPPKLMALHHPLDDLTRIIMKTGSGKNVKFCEWNSNRHKIVFTSMKPSICVTYDSVTGIHNIWHIRQICENDELNPDLHENKATNIEDVHMSVETTPSTNSPCQSQQPNLLSNLLNNTRLKQFQKKQSTPSSGIPSAVQSPTLMSINNSSVGSKQTSSISANSCVVQKKSQNSPSVRASVVEGNGTLSARNTPIIPGKCSSIPMTPDNSCEQYPSTNLSTREFMIRQGTPVRAPNTYSTTVGPKNSIFHSHPKTQSARISNASCDRKNTVTHIPITVPQPMTTGASKNTTVDATNRLMSSRDCDMGGTDEPSAPDFSLCLEHIWGENPTVKSPLEHIAAFEDEQGANLHLQQHATKIFLSNNIVGAKYLCFFYKDKGLLNILPYQEMQSSSANDCQPLIFGTARQVGSVSSQSDKSIIDAVQIDSLGMILTLEKIHSSTYNNATRNSDNINICLYAGCTDPSIADTKVADVHIETMHSGINKKGDLANIANEISALCLDGKRGKFLLTKDDGESRKYTNSKHTTSDSTQVEKGVVTSSRPPSASGCPIFNESLLSMLSPVAKSDPNFLASNTTDSKSNRTMQNDMNKTYENISELKYGCYRNAKLYYKGLRLTLTLPPVCTSSIVKRCLKSLYAYLPNQLSLKLSKRWYRMRNAPGPSSISASEEWKLFVKCIFRSMGYNIEKLKPEIFSTSISRSGNDSSISPVYAKKMRPNDSGSDADWQNLLESRSHVQSGEQISFLLKMQDVCRTNYEPQQVGSLNTIDNQNAPTLIVTDMDTNFGLMDPNAFLFEYIGSVLWCLHLLYENFKTNTSCTAYLSPMAVVLSKLAGDLDLSKYVLHYWKDFPMSCPKATNAAKTGQMSVQYRSLVRRPFLILQEDNAHEATKYETPPCIYSHLMALIDLEGSSRVEFGQNDDRFGILPNGATQYTQDLVIIYAILSLQKKKTENPVSKFNEPKISDYVKISRYAMSKDSKNDISGAIELVYSLHKNGSRVLDVAASIVRFVVERRYNIWTVINSYPTVLALPVFAAMFECRTNPRLNYASWAKEAYELIGRKDLAKRCLNTVKVELGQKDSCNKDSDSSRKIQKVGLELKCSQDSFNKMEMKNGTNVNDNTAPNYVCDGLESVESEVTRLRWPKDRRLPDVRRMLQSARPVIIDVEQRPEMSDHDFLEVQERALQALCVRTMALPIGRGALSFRTADPLPTETVPVPKLCLSGKAPPRGATVEMDHIDVVPNMERWPSFHNGVAAGLKIAVGTGVSYIDSNWITFNKPKESSSNPNELVEHGGFLMALGLNGQLATLGKLESFDYLIRGNDMISIGILLGTCAAKRGSMDILATKKVATQVEALLPSTATELPLSNTTQVAGLAGLGLLYQGTGHRQMAEVCLMELGRPPGPEMENCTDRESYSLSAGLALGMITLGKGDLLNKGSLSDLRLPETLYHHMVGGPRSPSVYRHRFRSPSSYQIQEGDTVNVDITSPGATLALGLMFFNSGNKTYANWMNAPDSQFLLEFVRPDFLMIRTLAKGLIMWDSILPNSAWIDSHVPSSIRPYCLRRPGDDISLPQNGPRGITGSIDYETINQAYCNIIAGAALAMGLRFAGSNNSQAFEVLHRITRRLLAISKRSVAELAGKATVEQTICVLVLSLAIVAAGSGDLEVVRIIRYLRSRVGPKNPTVTYGSHMALHLALGLLFLGGGRYTLSTSPEAVAAMVTAFFPKFPTHSNDNRYHLQALRHFYVLAAEPRLLIPRDIHSRRLVFSHVEIELKDTIWYKKCSYSQKAPVLLPELKYLKKVSIKDPRYHEILFNIDHHKKSDGNNFAQLQALFDEDFGLLDIQQKAGSLSYEDDPRGFRSLTGQCLTKGTHFRWNVSLDSSRLLSTFSLDPAVAAFTNIFISNIRFANSPKEKKIQAATIEQIMASILYECASQEKLDMLPFYIKIFQFIWDIGKPGQLLIGPQMAMLEKLTSQKHTECSGQRGLINRLVNPEIVTSIYQGLQYKFDFFLNHFGVKLAEGFLAHGKFDFGENLKNIKECSSEHGLGDEKNSTAFQEHAFASLLVMHQNMCQNQAESIEKLKFHSSKQNLNDQNSNLLKKILCNKNFNTE